MKTFVLVLLMIGAAAGLILQTSADNQRTVPFTAQIAGVDRAGFPYVRLQLAGITPIAEGRLPVVSETLRVTPVYSLTSRGTVDFNDPATVDNLEAYYLKPGDTIQAVLLMDSRKADGTYYITQVARMNEDGGQIISQPISAVRTDKTRYALGEPVRISLIVENRTGEVLTLQFPTGQRYDIWAESTGREVWRWSKGKAFTQAFTSLTLQPGERRVFEETWSQVNNDGKQVPPGAYNIFTQLTTVPPRPTPVRTQLTIGSGEPVVKPATIGGIIENIDTSIGQVVQISGTYLGWRPDPNYETCRLGPPVTRSDWAIKDDTGCIYVTGSSGLSPTDDYGKEITLSGIVRRTAEGQPYIEVQRVLTNNQ